MTNRNYTFTSESVSEGHPDKVCDRISDAVLDAFIAKEPEARVACETFATTNRVVIGGEVGLADQAALSDYMGRIDEIARACIKDIGYEQDKFHHQTVEVTNLLHEQSAHIAQGVDASADKDEGAGDQGIMFGYATNETADLMPAPIQYSHAILRRLAEVRKSGAEPTLGPDAKSQLSVQYENGKPIGVSSIVLSTQHLDETMSSDQVREVVEPYIRETLPSGWISEKTIWHVNPTGKFVIGGPDGDAGLTGRKIIVDTYGGKGAHGGGAFSGKDPSKVDRSAAYATRHIAKNLVAAGVCDEVLVQVAYAIGVADPVGLYVNTYGTSKVDVTDGVIAERIAHIFPMQPFHIEQRFKLRTPIYTETAAYGHMGRPSEVVTKTFATHAGGEPKQVTVELFPWEKLDKVEEVKKAFGL